MKYVAQLCATLTSPSPMPQSETNCYLLTKDIVTWKIVFDVLVPSAPYGPKSSFLSEKEKDALANNASTRLGVETGE